MSLQVRVDPNNLWGMPVYEEPSNGGALLVTVNNSNRWAVPIRYVPRGTGGAIPINYAGAGFVAPPAPPTATLLDSVDFTDPGDVDSFERSQAAGYTGSGDADEFQREKDVDELRDGHYQGGVGPLIILEDDPTEIALVGVTNLVVTPGVGKFSAAWDNPAVMANVGTIKYKIDAGSYVDAGLVDSLTDVVASAGTHTITVVPVSDISETPGEEVESDEFEVEAPAVEKSEDFQTGLNFNQVEAISGWVPKTGIGTMITQNLGGADGMAFTGANDGAIALCFWDTGTSAVEMEAEYYIRQNLSGASYTGVAVNVQTDANSWYAVYVYSEGWSLQKRIAGVDTELANETGMGTAANHEKTFLLRRTGTGASTRLFVYREGVERTPAGGVDPTTYLGAGKAGVVTYDDAGTAFGDNFVWRNLSGQVSDVKYDTFDSGTSGNDLTTISGWVAQEGAILLHDVGGIRVTGNSASATAVYYWGSATASLDQRAEITIQASAGGSYIGPAVRCQSGADSAYVVLVSPTSWELDKKIAGTYTTLASGSGTFSPYHRLALVVTGSGSATRLTFKQDSGSGWVDVAADVDPGTYLGAGYAGIGTYGNTAGTRGDNFKWATP